MIRNLSNGNGQKKPRTTLRMKYEDHDKKQGQKQDQRVKLNKKEDLQEIIWDE